MNSNDPFGEAMLKLASAIQHISADAKSRELAERAEVLILGAKLIEEFAALRNNIAAEIERLNRIQQAHEWMKEHMPKSVSTFGGSDGVFGWTGTDAAGNRVTWKVEPPVAESAEADASPAELWEQTMAAFVKAAPTLTAAAEKRFAADPFVPTFGVLPGEDKITIELRPRPGSVQYLINVTGPHSSAVRIVDGIPALTRVSRVEEVQASAEATPATKPGFWTRVVGAPDAIWVGEGQPPAGAAEGTLPAAALEEEILRCRSASTMHALHQVLINSIERCGADEATAVQAAKAFKAGLAAFDAPTPAP